MQFQTISIRHTDNGLSIIAMEEDSSRKSEPNVSQKGAEKVVQDMHNAVKSVSSYQSVSFSLTDIDHYDSDVDCYEVPGACIRKGQRKVEDTSWTKGSIPKGWEIGLSVRFGKVQKTTKPLTLALKQLGVNVDVKDIQKALKKNEDGQIYLNGEWHNGGWRSDGHYTYTIGTYSEMY